MNNYLDLSLAHSPVNLVNSFRVHAHTYLKSTHMFLGVSRTSVRGPLVAGSPRTPASLQQLVLFDGYQQLCWLHWRCGVVGLRGRSSRVRAGLHSAPVPGTKAEQEPDKKGQETFEAHG